MPVETTVALTGNTYLEHPVSGYRDERFLEVVEFLRKQDVTFTNMECAIPDEDDWPAFVAGMGWSATYMGGLPTMIDEMKFMGVNAIYAANNHVIDFGENGILSTARHLRERGMPFAGIGASLTEASEPCYVDAPNGRRVAMISTVDWGPRGLMDLPFPWPVGFMPSDDGPPYARRPGVNLLRYDTVYHVGRQEIDALRKVSKDLDWERAKTLRREGGSRDHPTVGPAMIGWEKDTDTEFFFMGRKFKASDRPGISTFCYQEDLDRVCKWVREARRQADVVIVANHDQSHGPGVHDYLQVFSRAVIDAGADIYLNHAGRHRGIEIYKGKAIIHGQPGLFLQNEQVTHAPSSLMPRMNLTPEHTPSDFIDVREECGRRSIEAAGRPAFGATGGSAVHVVVFDDQSRVKEVRVHPMEVSGGPRYRRGLPLMPAPDSEVSRRVLQWAAEKAKPFGTAMEVRNGAGIVRLT